MNDKINELLALVGKWRAVAHELRYSPAAMPFSALRVEDCADDLEPIAAALCAEVEALRKDAERYRWLVENGKPAAEGLVMRDPQHWNAAIDAARSRNEHEG